MTESREVLFEKRSRVAWITIDRAARRNSINAAVISGIASGIERSAADPDIRAIVLTGAGDKAFCVGADLSGGTEAFGRNFAEPSQPFANLLRAAHACRLPIVARVNGACLAGCPVSASDPMVLPWKAPCAATILVRPVRRDNLNPASLASAPELQ